MTASAKAAQIHQLPATAPVQQFPACLHRGLLKHATNIRGGDPDHDIDDVECQLSSHGATLGGTWTRVGQKIARLALAIRFRARTEVGIVLFATHGQQSAYDLALLGQSGQGIGNALLVARLLHVAIACARSTGITAFVNNPANQGLALKYERMGFIKGTRLPLDDQAQLARAFTYVETAYRNAKPPVSPQLDLSLPPLPL